MKKKYLKQTRSFYNQFADKFSATRNWWWKDLDFVGDYLEPSVKILDFGCGNGRLIEIIDDKKQIDYTGVDFSEGLILEAKRKYPKYKENFLKNNDATDLSFFKNEQFDRIFSIAVYHHFDTDYLKKHLKENHRILKEGGFLIVSVWYLWNRKRVKYLLRNLFFNFSLWSNVPFNSNGNVFQRPCYWWTQNKLKKVFESAGFEVEKSGFTVGMKNEKRNIFFVLKKRF